MVGLALDYKWIALSNVLISSLMGMINMSICFDRPSSDL